MIADRSAAQTPDASFRDFVVGSQRRMVNFAEFLVGDRGRAEDLVQDAYVKVYARWSRLQDGNPEAYVRRCVITGRADWWRRRASTERVVESDALARATSASASTVDSVESLDRRLVIFAALRRLTERERAVVVLRYYLGLSEAEIASELGLAAGTVKSASSRALAKLRSDPRLDIGALS